MKTTQTWTSEAAMELFEPFAIDLTASDLTAQVRGADDMVYALSTDFEEAQKTADLWNGETDPHNRAHSGAYPFRAELRS